MQVRCYDSPSACGYYRGGHCALFDELCTDMLTEERRRELGLKVRCYLDPASCKDYREDGGLAAIPQSASQTAPFAQGSLEKSGYCKRFCRRCSDVHAPGIWEDGQDECEEDEP